MTDYSKSILNQQETNPAAPYGAQQMAGAGADYAAGSGPYADSVFGKEAVQTGYNAQSTSWYTGANLDGTGNGWDNGFLHEANKQYVETQKQFVEDPHAFDKWLQRRDATGVVTWGDRRKPSDAPDSPRYGDIYNNGKQVANVFDDYHPKDANALIAPWVLDAKTQGKIFNDPGRDRWLADELETKRVQATDMLTKGVTARELNIATQAEQKREQGSGVGEALSVAGGIAGAGIAGAAAAAAATFETGPGVIPAVIGGFLFGAATSYANRDQLTELTSRAVMQSRVADEQFGGDAGLAAKVGGFSQVGLRLIDPFSNAVQGLADIAYGKPGDGTEEFYAVDTGGHRKISPWFQVADVAATLPDAILQFTNPVGRALYLTGTAGSTASDVYTFAKNDATFNARSGRYEDIEGFKQHLAAGLNIGIDFVQMGMARGIASAGRAGRAAIAPAAAEAAAVRAATGTQTGILTQAREAKLAVQHKLPYWAGGVGVGERGVTESGSRYVVDIGTGVAVHRGFSLASLAPSEFFRRGAVSVRTRINGPVSSAFVAGQREATAFAARNADAAARIAVTDAARSELKLVADDYYRNAVELASGRSSRFSNAMMNGFGEGAEEFVQNVLEPISHNAPIDFHGAALAFAYGAAAGVGMSYGSTFHPATQSQKLYGRALAKGLITGEMFSEEDFAKLPPDVQLAYAQQSEDDAVPIANAMEGLRRALGIRALDTGAMGQQVIMTNAETEAQKVLGSLNNNTTSLLKLLGFNNPDKASSRGKLLGHTIPTHHAELSAWRTVEEIRKNLEQLDVHRESFERDLAIAQEALKTPDITDEVRLQAESEIEQYTQGRDDALEAIRVGRPLLTKLDQIFEVTNQAQTPKELFAGIDEMNRMLVAVRNGSYKLDGVAPTVDEKRAMNVAFGIVFGRDPFLTDGSFMILTPWVSRWMTRDSVHGAIAVHQSLLAAIHGDHDGDNLRSNRNLMLDRKARQSLRIGDQYYAPVQTVDAKGKTHDSVKVKIDPLKNEEDALSYVRRAFTDSRSEVHDSANTLIEQLAQIYYERYKGVIKDGKAFSALLDELRTNLQNGVSTTRNDFLDGLATLGQVEIQDQIARVNDSAEMPWASQQFTAKLNAIQTMYANNIPEYEYEPGAVDPVMPGIQPAFMRENQLIEAANLATLLTLVRSGVSATRGKQALHYDAMLAAVDALKFKDNLAPEKMEMLTRFLEEVSGGKNRSSIEDIMLRDSTTTRVLDWLQDILIKSNVDFGAHGSEALVLLSFSRVQDFDFVDGVIKFKDRDIGLLQMLLRQSVRIDQAAIESVKDQNPDVVNKLKTLNGLTRPKNDDAGHSTALFEAGFEVFADIPGFQLIGENSMFLGMQMTPRMLRAQLLDMDREHRATKVNKWRRKAPYLGRKETSNPPYTKSEIDSGKLTAYRALVDMVDAVANKASPNKVKQSKKKMLEFKKGLEDLTALVNKFRSRLSKTEAVEYEALPADERALWLINQVPELTRAVAELFPAAIVRGAFMVINGREVHAANWVTEMLGMPAPEALMHYWRNVTLSEFFLSGMTLKGMSIEEQATEMQRQHGEDVDGVKKGKGLPRNFSKLQTTSARAIYEIVGHKDKMLLLQFLRELHEAKDLQLFMDDVMNSEIYLGDHPPIAPFSEDVSDIDTSFERSWQSTFPGARQREAITKFSKAAAKVSEDLDHAVKVQSNDTQLAGKLVSFFRKLGGEDVKKISDDAEYYARRLAQLAHTAYMFGPDIGPTMRDNATATSQGGLRATQNKGKGDPSVAPLGMARQMADGGGSEISLVNAVADVTVHTEADILQNPSQLVYRSMLIQLDSGHTIEWTAPDQNMLDRELNGPRPDLLQMSRLLKDPTTSGFMKQILGFTVQEVTKDGKLFTARYKGPAHKLDHSLLQLLERSDLTHLFPRPDRDISTEQAHEVISMVSGGVFRKVLGASPDVQAGGYYPLQMAIDELVTSYTHSLKSPLRENKKAEDMRDEVYRVVAQVLMILAHQKLTSQVDYETAVQLVKDALRERYGSVGAPDILEGFRTPEERVAVMHTIAQSRMEQTVLRQEELVEELKKAKTKKARAVINEKRLALAEEAKQFTDDLKLNLSDISVDSTLAMFTISKTDPLVAATQKKLLLGYLGSSRMGSLDEIELDTLRFVRRQMITDEYDKTGIVRGITDPMWNDLSRAAATLFLTERARITGSSVSKMLMVGSDGEWKDLNRYFDHTWSFLLDNLLKESVIDSMVHLVKQAQWDSHLRPDKAAAEIMRRMFNKKNLGNWGEPVVELNLANRDSLMNSGVGLNVAIPGTLSTTMEAVVAATERNLSIPAEGPTTVELSEENLDDVNMQVLLEGAFVQRNGGLNLTYTKTDGTEEIIDLFDDHLLAQPWGSRADSAQNAVRQSGYTTITVERLLHAIELAQVSVVDRDPAIPWTIPAIMFDIRERPGTPEMAHNIFYSGIGREGAAGTRNSLIAELFFSADGVYQRQVQDPLESVGEGRASFVPTSHIERDPVRNIEASGVPIYDQLVQKTHLLMAKDYDFGRLQTHDRKALMEWLRVRHEVLGTDAEGKQVLWSVDRAIASQRATSTEQPLSNMRMVPLSIELSNAVLGSTVGTSNQVVAPNLDQRQVTSYIEHTLDLMHDLGITNLGEEGDFKNTKFRHQTVLSTVAHASQRDTQRIADYIPRLESWSREQSQTLTERADLKMNIGSRLQSVGPLVRDAITQESLGAMMATLGLKQFGPPTDSKDALASDMVNSVLSRFESTIGNTVGLHQQGVAANPAHGLFSNQSFDDKKSAYQLVFGDHIFIDLSTFDNGTDSYSKQLELAMKVVAYYAGRGVYIHLINAKGARTLREDLRDFLENSGTYEAISSHSLVPITDEKSLSQTERAEDRTQIETRVLDPNSVILEFRSSQLPQTNEGLAHINTEGTVTDVVRSNVLSRRPQDFGRPQTAEQTTFVREKLKDLLRDPAAFEHLVALAETGESMSEEDRALFSQQAEEAPTTMTARQAMDKLKSQLEAGDLPTSPQQIFGHGFFDPMIGPGGTIYLVRQGYKSLTALDAQYNASIGVGETVPRGGTVGIGVAVAPAERDESLGSNVGVLERLVTSALGGGQRAILRVPIGQLASKATEANDAVKLGVIPLPDSLKAPRIPLANEMTLTLFTGLKDTRKKEALFGLGNNFRNLFMIGGADFRADMIEFITGKRPTPATISAEWIPVRKLLEDIADGDFNIDESAVAAALRTNSFLDLYGPLIATQLKERLAPGQKLMAWTASSDKARRPHEYLAIALIGSLLVTGVRLEHVISTPGLTDPRILDPASRVKLMPQIFTDALDDYGKPALRKMLFDRFNANLPPQMQSGDRHYMMLPDWTFIVRMLENGRPVFMEGELKVTDLFTDDLHPDLLVQSEQANEKSGTSFHAANQANVQFGVGVAHRRDLSTVDALFTGVDLSEMSLWNALQSMPEKSIPEDRQTNAQRIWTKGARRTYALNLRTLNKSKWSKDDKSDYKRQSRQLSHILFGNEVHVDEADYLIRLYLGARGVDPDNKNEEPGVDTIAADVALSTLALLIENVNDGYFPLFQATTGGLIDYELMSMIFDAQKSMDKPTFAPLAIDGNKRVATKMDINDWINTAFGQMEESRANFNPAYLKDLDGAWASYSDATTMFGDMAPSTNRVVSLKLLNPGLHEMVASLDPTQRVQLTQVIGMEGSRMTLESIIRSQTEYGRATADQVTDSAIAERLERFQRWRSQKGLQKASKGKTRDFLQVGAHYSHESKGTNRILRDLTNLRLGLAMFNFALWVAAVPETHARNLLDGSVSLIRGESTGAFGRTASVVGEKLNLEMRFSPDSQKAIKELKKMLGNDPRFMAMIWSELIYIAEIEPGDGKVGHFLQQFATAAARMQDPTWGMFAGTVAKRYVETALSYIAFDPTNVVTVEAFLANMNRDPEWLSKNTPKGSDGNRARALSAHSSALNAVAQIRAIRMNVVGKTARGIWNPLIQSGKPGQAILGHLIKWPMIFSNYTAGAAMFITGTGYISDFVALSMHGRETAGSKLQNAMRGSNVEPDYYDMSDVLEGIDLSRSFLRAGVTWSGYMAYMLMGGVGLSGEDKEAKRRRLMAMYYGMPLQYDPLARGNDFRDQNAVFLDGLPGPLASIGSFFLRPDGEGGGTAVMTPHWIVKQFISPLVGIERAMSTGDIRQIGWGFKEAASVMPLSTLNLFNEAVMSAKDLERLTEDKARINTESSMSTTNRLLISLVGVYERGFLESSWVNTIRNGSDKWDRDPWVAVRTDSHGTIIRDETKDNLPLPTKALESFTDAKGNVHQGYAQRTYWEAQLHAYAENNATFSLLASAFTGFGNSTYRRGNMAVKQRKIPLKGMDLEASKGLFLKEFDKVGATPFTLDEAVKLRRNQIHLQTGSWSGTSNAQLTPIVMSELDHQGHEVLTKDGARTIFESKYAGTVDLNAPSLRGIFVPTSMRKEIQAELVTELIHEGVSWGMDEVTAKARAKRIWFGHDTEHPDQPGLREIVWSNEVSTQKVQNYNQLNTVFVLGPGGKPYATGQRRDSWLEALGVNFLGTGQIVNQAGGMDVDIRNNSVDKVLNINTGLRGLVRNEAADLTPDDKGLQNTLNSPLKPFDNNGNGFGGFRHGGFRRFGHGGGGRGGGGGFTVNVPFTRMGPFFDAKAPFANGIPFINTSNPILRRADIRRERVGFDRGRLFQWQ